MLTWYAIGGLAIAYIVSWIWILIEIVRAPLVDEQYRVISDPQRVVRLASRGSTPDVRIHAP